MEDSPNAWMDSMLALRSLLLSHEESLKGHTLVSAETVAGIAADDEYDWIRVHFALFLRGLRSLSPLDQEFLLSYYALGKAQVHLAEITKLKQTEVSAAIRFALKRLALGDASTAVPRILKRAGLEDALACGLSTVVLLYAQKRSFDEVADTLKLRRPSVRKTMRQASKTLLASKDQAEQMAGAYIHGLLFKAAYNVLPSAAERYAQLYLNDPSCLGQFRIGLEQAGVEALFTSRAARHVGNGE